MSEPKFLSPKEFDRLFAMALTDTEFRKDVGKRGLVALESKGFELNIPKKTRDILDKTLRPVGPLAGDECKVCAVCTLCVLCGEANAASAAAAVTNIISIGAPKKTILPFPRKPRDLGLSGRHPPTL